MIAVEKTPVRDSKGVHIQQDSQQPLPHYMVNVVLFRDGLALHPKSRPLLDNDFRAEVRKWCDEHCTGAAYIGKKKTVHFEEPGDALLFWLSHERV